MNRNEIEAKLDEALSHIKNKNKPEAYRALAAVLREEQQNERAWFLMGYAVKGIDKKIKAFENALKINPYNEDAEKNIKKLKQMRRNKAVSGAKSMLPASVRKDTWKWVAIAVVGLIVVGAGGGYLLSVIRKATANTQLQAMQPTDTPVLSATPSPFPSPTSINQATATPDFTVTFTPTLTSTATTTPLPLSLDVQADMELIREEVSDIRNLPIRQETLDELTPQIKMRLILLGIYSDQISEQALDLQTQVFTALGFMRRSYDLEDVVLSSEVDYFGGYYNPEAGRVHLIDLNLDSEGKWAYAHEYMHALLDQHYGIASMGLFPGCAGPIQGCMAARVLVEGDAQYVQSLWYDDNRSLLRDLNKNALPPNTDLFFVSEGDEPPPYFAVNASFPYAYGEAFIEYLYEEAGGWDLVNDAYEDLPTTTEQIMHPEKFVDREDALPVNDPDLGQVLGEEWGLLRADSLGEWDTALLLSYNAYPTAQLDFDDALDAAEGWGGDLYQVYMNQDTEEIVMSAHWIWDTEEDQAAFYDALTLYLADRFFSDEIVEDPEAPDQICWTSDDRVTCVYSNGEETLWLMAPSQELFDSVLTLFPTFRFK